MEFTTVKYFLFLMENDMDISKLWNRNCNLNFFFFFSFQTYSHEVYFDKDLVLHIEQKPNRRFSCYVYQMVCDTAKDDDS